MIEQRTFSRTIDILQNLDVAPAPNALRRESARRAFLQRAAELRAERALHGKPRTGNPFGRLIRLSAAGLAGIVTALAVLTGAAYAANDSAPGDFLYSLDRAQEQISLVLAGSAEERVQLQLAISEERLLESEQLAASGDQANMAIALDAYGSAISALAKTVAEERGEPDAVDALVNQTLSAQEQRLMSIREHVPSQALPNLDRAIDAAQQAQENRQSPGNSESAPGHNPSPADSKHDPRDGKGKTHGRPDDAGGSS